MSQDENLPCIGKLAFDSQKLADATALTAMFQHGAKVKSYHCKHCKLWHLATNYDKT